jgi:hypothetical protein
VRSGLVCRRVNEHKKTGPLHVEHYCVLLFDFLGALQYEGLSLITKRLTDPIEDIHIIAIQASRCIEVRHLFERQNGARADFRPNFNDELIIGCLFHR